MTEKFKSLLDESLTYPTDYTFKFIAPAEQSQDLIGLLEGCKVDTKPSAKGNYMSFTAVKRVQNSDEILGLYQSAARIPKIISL